MFFKTNAIKFQVQNDYPEKTFKIVFKSHSFFNARRNANITGKILVHLERKGVKLNVGENNRVGTKTIRK